MHVQVEFNGRKCVKTEYFFHPSQIPENYYEVSAAVSFQEIMGKDSMDNGVLSAYVLTNCHASRLWDTDRIRPYQQKLLRLRNKMGSRGTRSSTVLLNLHKGWKHRRILMDHCHAAPLMKA